MNEDITGKLIRNSRKKKGLSQEQLAKLVNLSTMSIRRYESGERIIPDDKLQAIVAVLGDSFYDSLNQYIDETPVRIAKKMEAWEQQWRQQKDVEETSFRHKVIEEIREDIAAFIDSENGIQIILTYFALNEKGQHEAVKRLYELTRLDEFKRTDEKDTIKQEKPSEEQ